MFEGVTSPGLSPDQVTTLYPPGTKVRVTQQVPKSDQTVAAVVEGKVLRHERQGSGSWFARNKKAKLWLDRLIVEKADGEVSILNLDEYSRVEVLEGPAPAAGQPPLALPVDDPMASIT